MASLVCRSCGSVALLECKCQKAHYCGKECQRQDWTEHRVDCTVGGKYSKQLKKKDIVIKGITVRRYMHADQIEEIEVDASGWKSAKLDLSYNPRKVHEYDLNKRIEQEVDDMLKQIGDTPVNFVADPNATWTREIPAHHAVIRVYEASQKSDKLVRLDTSQELVNIYSIKYSSSASPVLVDRLIARVKAMALRSAPVLYQNLLNVRPVSHSGVAVVLNSYGGSVTDAFRLLFKNNNTELCQLIVYWLFDQLVYKVRATVNILAPAPANLDNTANFVVYRAVESNFGVSVRLVSAKDVTPRVYELARQPDLLQFAIANTTTVTWLAARLGDGIQQVGGDALPRIMGNSILTYFLGPVLQNAPPLTSVKFMWTDATPTQMKVEIE